MNESTMKALRQIGTKTVSGYSHVLKFTREFTSGTLVGMTHDDQISFCSAASCDEWVSEINAANRAGKLEYKVVSFRVESL